MELSDIKDDNLLEVAYMFMELDNLLQYKERLITYSNHTSLDETIIKHALGLAVSKEVKQSLNKKLNINDKLRIRIKERIVNVTTQIKLLKYSI